MRLTTRGKNAVIALFDLCLYSNDRPVTLAAIHERQGVSIHYLEQIFGKMRKAGLVKSIRGPGGGYVFNRHPKEIKIAEVIITVEDDWQVTACKGSGTCHKGHMCLSHHFWYSLEKVLDDFFYGTSLYDAANFSAQKKLTKKIPFKDQTNNEHQPTHIPR